MASMPGGGRKRRPRSTVLVRRRDMPGRKRPTPEDAMTACHVLPGGLARDADTCGLTPRTPRAAERRQRLPEPAQRPGLTRSAAPQRRQDGHAAGTAVHASGNVR